MAVLNYMAPLSSYGAAGMQHGTYMTTAAPAVAAGSTNHDRWDPFRNLIASHHNANIVPSKQDDHILLEVETHSAFEPPSGNAVSDESQESQETNIRRNGDGLSRTDGSTTALGAITLLAFLNLLGYIQTVLSSNGRRRRSADEEGAEAAEERGIPVPPIPTLVGELLQGLGFWQEEEKEKELMYASSRYDPPIRRKGGTSQGTWGSFFSTLGQRFKLAANVMGFLTNPGPSRVRRSVAEVLGSNRSKRFTSSMNTWYEDLAGRNYDVSVRGHLGRDGGAGGGLLSQLMLGLGRQLLGV